MLKALEVSESFQQNFVLTVPSGRKSSARSADSKAEFLWCKTLWAAEETGQRDLKGLKYGAFDIVRLLKSCAKQKDLHKGSQVHAYILDHKLLQKSSYICSALINMYARCGALVKAQQVLDDVPIALRNVVSWNALIAGYAQHGQGEEALKCFDCMQHEGQLPNAVTFTCALKACGSIGEIFRGEVIHGTIVSLGILENDAVLGNTLVDMYARCGTLTKAQQVFDELPVRDVVAWNALLAGYAQQGHGEEALKCFESMQHEGHLPNAVTFTCALKACWSIGAVGKGDQIYDKIVSSGMLQYDNVVGSSLVDMYARCGALAKAQLVLNELPMRNAVTWNALIGGYIQQGQGEEALKCFDCMQREGYSPDAASFACALTACASIGALVKGKQIHDKLANMDMLENDVVLGSTLVDMYARCGALAKAQQVFDELPVRDVVAWTALVAGYVQQGQGDEALMLIDTMQYEGHSLSAVTFTCALKACGSLGAIAKGEQLHEKIVSLDMLETNIALRNILMDMYVRCGALAKAREIFDQCPVQDVVAWTTLISGYAQQGQSKEALYCFERMQSKGITPCSTTFVRLLNACSHSGLLDHAKIYFSRMNEEHGFPAGIEHYCCMVDVFGRAGKLEKALLEFEKISCAGNLPFWLALLGACRKWGDVKIGRLAFQHALYSNGNDGAAYACMANIYTADGAHKKKTFDCHFSGRNV